MLKQHQDELASRLNVESFSETILFKALSRLPKLSSEGPWLAGGALRKTFQGIKLDSDFDFFFKSKDQFEKFQDKLEKKGAKLLSQNDKNQKWILPSEIPDGAEGENIYLPEMEIQLINFQYYENAEQVIDSFDYTLCQFAYDGAYIYMSDFALWDVARKKLVPHKITFGAASIRRMMKYANQGFNVCGGCITEVLRQVAENPSIIQSETLYID